MAELDDIDYFSSSEFVLIFLIPFLKKINFYSLVLLIIFMNSVSIAFCKSFNFT